MRKTKAEILENFEPPEDRKVIKTRLIALNTVQIDFEDGGYIIRFHQTNIVNKKPNGNIVLNTDGWRTLTTKERINWFLPHGIHLYQENFKWFLYIETDNGNKIQPFYDGIEITPTGEIVNPKVTIKQFKEQLKLSDQLNKLIKQYAKQITENNLEQIMQTSCPKCQTVLYYNPNKEEIRQHLLEHLRTNTFSTEILEQALISAGYQSYQIVYHVKLKIAYTFQNAVRKFLQKYLLTN